MKFLQERVFENLKYTNLQLCSNTFTSVSVDTNFKCFYLRNFRWYTILAQFPRCKRVGDVGAICHRGSISTGGWFCTWGSPVSDETFGTRTDLTHTGDLPRVRLSQLRLTQVNFGRALGHRAPGVRLCFVSHIKSHIKYNYSAHRPRGHS